MKPKKLFHFAVLSCLAFGLMLAGCGSNNTSSSPSDQSKSNTTNNNAANNQPNTDAKQIKEEDKYGGTAKLRFHQQPPSFGYPPTMVVPANSVPISQPALETLGRFKEDGTMGPWLAEKWDQDSKANTITVYLRKGIKFHDGTDFNAEAVKWNIDKVLEAKRSLVSTVDSVEVIDPNTVRFHLKQWANSAVNELFWSYPMASPAAFEKLGKEGMEKHPVGTGPFKFDSMKNDVFIKYVRNENYWQKGLPYLDAIEWRIIIDNNTAMNSVLGKEVDTAIQLPADLLDQVKDRKDMQSFIPTTKLGLTGVGLISDSADPNSPFADVRVRKAISYAIDKKELTQSLMHGFATTTNQLGLPGGWSYNPDVDSYDYNPEKAKQLLAEAGYPNGFKTKLNSMGAYNTLVAAVQGYLAEVGINAEINIVEPARFNAMVMNEGWDGLATYFFLTETELSTILTEHFGPNTEIYGTHSIRPEKVQQLNVQFNAETDMEKRKKLAFELQKTMIDEYHMFSPLYVMQTPVLKQAKVHDDGFYTITGKLFSPEKMWIEK